MKKNILNKIVLAAFISTMVLGSSAFADTTVSADIENASAVESAVPKEAEMSILSNENSSHAVYNGKVTSVESDKDGYYNIIVSETGLRAYVSDKCVVIDAADGSIKTVSDIKEGMDIMVIVGQNTPMTMSIPPMTSSVSAVIINADSNIDYSVYNSELVNAENSLALNIGENTKIMDLTGAEADAESIKNSEAIVLYGISTRSIPAQTTPDLIVVTGNEKETDESTEPLKLRETCEEAGYTVKWKSNDEPVEIANDTKTIYVTAGSDECTVNGIKVELSSEVYLDNGTMMAPYDFIKLL